MVHPEPASPNSPSVTHWHCVLGTFKRALPTTAPSTPGRTVWLTRSRSLRPPSPCMTRPMHARMTHPVGSLARAPCGRPRSLADTIYPVGYTVPEPTEPPSASPSPPLPATTAPETTEAGDDGDNDGDGDGDGDGAPTGAWTANDVARMTTAGDAESCYYAIFAGEACTTAGAVYKITTNWCALSSEILF